MTRIFLLSILTMQTFANWAYNDGKTPCVNRNNCTIRENVNRKLINDDYHLYSRLEVISHINVTNGEATKNGGLISELINRGIIISSSVGILNDKIYQDSNVLIDILNNDGLISGGSAANNAGIKNAQAIYTINNDGMITGYDGIANITQNSVQKNIKMAYIGHIQNNGKIFGINGRGIHNDEENGAIIGVFQILAL